MLEVLQFVLGSFWRFSGACVFLLILGGVVIDLVNAVVNGIVTLRRRR